MMRKTGLVLLMAAMAVSLAACSKKETKETTAALTEAVTTEAVTTEAATTEAVTTEAATTEAATTEAATTEAPATEAPTTEAPTTEAPTTEAPVTEAATTEAPTTEAPTTEAPATEEADDEKDSSEITVPTTYRSAITLSDEDINLMASVLTLECGNEPYSGQLAVANVIVNRMIATGGSVADVVYAPNQFTVVTSDAFEGYVQNGAQASCVQAVKEALSGTNNIGDFNSFRPTWNIDTEELDSYTTIGNHIFF